MRRSIRRQGTESQAFEPGASEIEVIHIGPHPLTVGGTQSVIRTIWEWSIGADRISISPTWNGPRQIGNANLVRRAAGAVLRANRTTIIHVHISTGGAYLRDGPLIALARSRGLRVVVSIHGFDPQFTATHTRLVRTTLAPAHGILCLSDEALDTVRGLGVGAKSRKLPNPVAIDTDSPPAHDTEPVALFAGRIGTPKGVDVLQDAWRILLDRGVGGFCRIVGPIDEDYRPSRLDRMSIEGAVDPRHIRPLIRTARVVTLPSRAEGMPMILTEALAAGRPFVATPIGGTEALAPCEGMIVPVGDAGALADAIERFLSDPHAAQSVGARCREFCRETRGPEVISTELRKFYRSL